MLFCGYCERRMQGNWNNDQAYYRCRFPTQYAMVNRLDQPKVVYLREVEILDEVDGWLGTAFGPTSLERTIAAMADQVVDPNGGALYALRKRVSDCDRKLGRYRAALDAGGDPVEISSWINETKRERARLEGELKAVPAAQRISTTEIRAMMEEVGDLVRLIADSDPDDKAELYTKLGLKLTYYPEKQYVEARIEPEPPHVQAVSVRGWSRTNCTPFHSHISVPAGIQVMPMSPSIAAVRRIQFTTIMGVSFLAAIAGMVSFRHMRELCLRHGEDMLAAVLIPLAVDGTIVVASMSILLANRYGSRGGVLAWTMLVVGSLASLGANVAVAEPSLIGRFIAAWPSAALIGSYELLMSQIRRVPAGALRAEGESYADGEVGDEVSDGRRCDGQSGVDLHVSAWRWAQANRGADGALPTGKAIAERFSRSPRWGRWVKSVGLAGEFER
ncbi:DUF2637 domain-containing protein [Spongiactinospora sp. TRM90649]|uniref:DUF2637 domain-containing protein n=1 Tax=Spongiactinospora sp. TRM90649 TaxID=3031114 RepID=UPI0023F72D01|nr:DUF2637 domain-containing protein [Spongiactinospora sp. TRM90649]MDF5759397.1 DUF2637 domain-containing protein [Spongiactinospora sp. TRM90649]